MEAKMEASVSAVIAHYPPQAKRVFRDVRKLLLKVAKQTAGLANTEETLKWGEPSYLAKGGSTIRMKWTEKQPDEFSVFFNCNTSLIETIKELYSDEFSFDGQRALSFSLHEPIPANTLEHCFSMAMDYHRLKKLPLLGN